MKLVLGTRSPGKALEIRQILRGFDCVPLPADAPVVVEDQLTFRGNAEKKALFLAKALDAWVLADDSGLEVDALGGEPGILSHRWAGEPSDDGANNLKLVRLLDGVPEPARTARYRCAVVVAFPGGVAAAAEGVCEGRITAAPRGTAGFGYDPYFLSVDLDKTFAEASPAEKHRVSHRGRALAALRLPRTAS